MTMRYPHLNFLKYLFSFNRQIALRMTPFLAKTPLTPNQLTTLSMLAGIGAGFYVSLASRPGMLGAAFLMQLSFILDNCDGQIARIKNMRSEFGKYYDFTADLLVDFSLWIGLGIACAKIGYETQALWLTGIACLGSLINFIRVVTERKSVTENEKKQWEDDKISPKSPFLSALHVLSHDGDPSILLWAMAFLGSPEVLLIAGTVYIHALWIAAAIQSRIEVNRHARNL